MSPTTTRFYREVQEPAQKKNCSAQNTNSPAVFFLESRHLISSVQRVQMGLSARISNWQCTFISATSWAAVRRSSSKRCAPPSLPPSTLMTLWQRSTRWDIEFHSEWWAGSPSWHSLTPCEVPEWVSALDDPDVTPPTLQSPFVFYVLNSVHCIPSCNYV